MTQTTLTKLSACVVLALSISACATTPPPRAAYTGKDVVGAVAKEMLVGSWRSRILNPIPGEENARTTFSLGADGSMSGLAVGDLGGIKTAMESIGKWDVQGDKVLQTIESMKPAAGNENAMAGLASKFATGMFKKKTAALNVFEATTNRLILVSPEGQAQEWVRQ